MGLTRRQFVLTSTLIATAMLLGCAQAQGGYVVVPSIADQGNSCTPDQSLLADIEASAATAGDAAASQPTSDGKHPQAPLEPPAPSGGLPHAACNFGQGSGAGSSSSSATGNGPSNTLVTELPRPQLPQLELSCLLPLQTDDAHPFSVSSFLFRPPRWVG